MEFFNPHFFVLTLGLVGVVIIIAALLSGLIDRSDLPQIGVFLALGAMLGPAGLGLLDITLESPILRIVAPLSLVLVLFTDAVGLSIAEVRRHGALAFRVLGPGTLLSAGLIALAGWLMLGLPLAGAAILGAALASTDPVMLRGLLRRPGLPESVRLALRLESGLNDAVLLPVVLLAMPFLGHGGFPSQTEWARLGLDLVLLGPGAGIAVGLLAIAALEIIWSGFTVLSWPVFFFAVIVVSIRPIAFFVSLAGTRLDFRSRLLIAWFGPRGLSSLLLILLPVFAAVPGTEPLFFICCLIVLLSVALHGGSLMLVRRDGATGS